MFVKRFEAPTIEKALQLVKNEFGPSALILSTNELKGNLFKKGHVEVTAALERKEKVVSQKEFDQEALLKVFPHRRVSSPHKNRYVDIAPAPVVEEKGNKRNHAIKYEEGFLRLGFGPESAKDIARRLVFDYPKSDLASPSFVERAKNRIIASSIRTMSLDQFLERRTWIPLGIGGVGKTSLLVKIAIFLKGKEVPVSLMSSDRRKISARTELASYARLLKIPFSIEDKERRSHGIQLIDSPALRLNAENSDLEMVIGANHKRSTFVVLDATSRYAEMMRVLDHARVFSPEAIAFTKLDAAGQHGVIYDVLAKSKLPLLGLSIDQSFKAAFRFYSQAELAAFLLKEIRK